MCFVFFFREMFLLDIACCLSSSKLYLQGVSGVVFELFSTHEHEHLVPQKVSHAKIVMSWREKKVIFHVKSTFVKSFC